MSDSHNGAPPAAASPALSPLKRAFLALEQAQARVAALEAAAREPIAIIGLGCRTPGGAQDGESFWRVMRDGVDAIAPVPAERFDIEDFYDANPEVPGKIATREGGFLGAIDGFDAGFFGNAPREAQGMDPQQRLLLEVCWEALEHACQAPDRLERTATGVYMAVCSSDYAYLQLQSGDRSLLDAHFTSGIAHSVFSGRLSYLLGLQGPSVTIDTACSSSLVTIHLACQSLRAGECRMALAGGVNLILAPDLFIALSHSRMLAPDGRCKTFDAAADGFARGEGCGVIVLKRLRDAQADGDNILAVIRGSAVNQDGPSSGLTAPNGPAQEAVIREALARAGVAPRAVGFIEAHGTGTQLGDPLEVNALAAVFKPDRSHSPPLWVGSAKTNVGHLESAAGVTGLIKVVLALQHREIPAHLHFHNPSPHIQWADFPIRVPTQTVAWEPIDGRRIAGVSSFGFSGTNAHIVLEEAPPQREATHGRPGSAHLFTLSARDTSALAQLAARHASALAQHTDTDLADVSFTANVGRAHLPERAAIVVHSILELREALESLAQGQPSPRVRTSSCASRDPPRIAFLYTGQGAQYANMARGLYETAPVFRAELDRCAQLLVPHLARPLLEVLFPFDGASATLDETAYTQPALFAVEYALTQLWRSWGVSPDIVIGHSVGEVVAACVAGVLELEDALRLIAARGRLMQSLPAGGGMAAINATESDVVEAIAPYALRVSIAAVNGPAQTVISGSVEDVTAMCERFVAKGTRCRQLPVSHAFHSPLVEPILERFEREVAGLLLSKPRLRLVSNLTGRVAEGEEIVKPLYWRKHVREAVRFGDGLETLGRLRPDCLIEIGPQPTLLAFAGAVYGDDGPRRIASLRKNTADWDHILDALGSVYLAGASIDWRAVGNDGARRFVNLPTYPFQRERCWFHAKPQDAVVASRGRATGHPLLGTRLRSASADAIYEACVGADTPRFVRQHRVLGRVILPATAYLDTLLACGRDALRAFAVSVENVVVSEAMLLADDGEQRLVQTVYAHSGDDGAVSVSSSPLEAEEDAEWIPHVTANLRMAKSSTAAARSLDAARALCTRPVTPQAFYADFESRGLDFGPGFRVMRELWCGELQALGAVELAPDFVAESTDYGFHPLLLDGCLQVMAAAFPPEDAAAVYLPIGIGRYTVHRPPGARCWSHVELQSAAGETRRASIHIFDERGALLAQLEDIQLKRATRSALARQGERWLDDCLYEVQWRAVAPAVVPQQIPAGSTRGTWLVLADQRGTASGLVASLRARGDSCVVVRPGPFALTGDSATLQAVEGDDFRRLLDELGKSGRPVHGVIHLWSLDSGPADTAGVVSAMLAARALVSTPPVPRLYVVTRGAQVADGRESSVAPMQAAAWGLGRALAVEHPELMCVCVDLDPTAAAEEAGALLVEIYESGSESQVAYRAGARYVARLARARRLGSAAAGMPTKEEAWRLVPQTQGSLDAFRFDPSQRREPGPGEVEIAVEATALNFRDVLNALGLYPGDPGPLGGECAGRVVAVGAGVTRLTPGDEVMAVAGGSFASFVTARAELVRQRPENVSVEDAAAFSIPYLTAEFCLGHLARMRRGSRVLIHAAAGGVGMAAVHLALRAGAEVFATAGSAWKRELLRSIGVTHLLDSRTTTFKTEIMTLTGGRGVDIVLNSLSGELIEASFSVLASGGYFVEIGKRGIKDPAWVVAQNRDWRYSIVDWGETSLREPALIGGIYARLVDELSSGALPPLPKQVFALERAGEAFRFMAQARHAGKIVVRHGAVAPLRIRRDGTYIVTGGLSGLGLVVARWLSDRGAGRLVLLGRRGLTREAEPVVDELRATGTEVVVQALDVAQEAGLRAALAEVRASGAPLRGVLHSAGVFDDAGLTQQSEQRFANVLNPKVHGGRILDALTRDDPLDFFVLFSSAAAVLGSAGQTNYSAANAYLDGLAYERRSRGVPALSVNWGAWAETGVATTRGLLDRLAAQGLAALTAEQSLLALQRLLEAGATQATVMAVDWKRYVERVTRGKPPAFLAEVAGGAVADAPAAARTAEAAKGDSLRQQLAEAVPSRRKPLVAAFVRDRALRALGVDPAKPVDPRTPLGDLGLDSLLAVDLRNTLGSALGKPLPATLLFDHPSIEALTDYLLSEVLHFGDEAQGVSPDVAPAVPAVRELVGSIEAMSDDEVDRLIASRAQRKA